jgi:SAM-dependent methyltransferase
MTDQGVKDFRRTSYEGWQATAPGWERRRPMVEATAAAVREWMLRALAPEPGETVVELAAGAGDTGYAAAELVGERGRVISTDFAPAMVDAARRRAAELGLANVEHRVMDAERIELPADSVDGVLCRFGFMLMADPAAAAAEARRVLRPGGPLVLAVWGPPDRNPAFSILGRTLVPRGHMPPPDPEAPGPFRLGAPQRLRALLEDAGFVDVRIEEVPARFPFADVGEYLELVADTSAPTAGALAPLSGDERSQIAAEVEAGFAPFRSGGGYEVPGVALCAVAR